MQLSTSTPSPDSNPLGFLPASAGPRPPSSPGAVEEPVLLSFADLMPPAEPTAAPSEVLPVPPPPISATLGDRGPRLSTQPSVPAITDARAFQTLPFDTASLPATPGSRSEPAKDSAEEVFGENSPEGLIPSVPARVRAGSLSVADELAAENAAAQMIVPFVQPAIPVGAPQPAKGTEVDHAPAEDNSGRETAPLGFSSPTVLAPSATQFSRGSFSAGTQFAVPEAAAVEDLPIGSVLSERSEPEFAPKTSLRGPLAASSIESPENKGRSIASVAPTAPGQIQLAGTGLRSGDSGREAISAANPSAEDPARKITASTRPLNFLKSDKERLGYDTPEVGTTVAKEAAVMPATVSPLSNALVAASATTANAVPATPARSLTPAETLAAAHRAVDAVLATTERFVPSTQSVANLKLSVGDSELAVRVEVRAGEIHATFRTDSPELRAALAHEWRSAVMQPAEQPLRLAAPVFASSERSMGDHSGGYSGEQPAQGREQPARSAAEFVLPGNFRSKAASESHGGETPASAPALRVLPSTTQHLHAFA